MKNIKSIITVATLIVTLSTTAFAGDIAGMRNSPAEATGTIPGMRPVQTLVFGIAVSIRGSIPGMLTGIISIR